MIKLIQGDCLNKLKEIEDNSIDLIFTSPPYAEQRKNCYNSIKEEKYVEWFLPIANELKRVLKNTGSFFLNIKPHTKNGQKSLYVFQLVSQIKLDLDFWFVDEYCWIKNAFPGNYRGRFKNGFEPIYHFTKNNPNQIIFNPLACGNPVKPESLARANRKQCSKPKNGSGMTAIVASNIKNIKIARPSNVISVNNVSNQFSDKQKHPATFPIKLVDFFIKSFTNKDSVILDPFMGSGTTGLACKYLNRNFIGIELNEEYFNIANKRINKTNNIIEIFE